MYCRIAYPGMFSSAVNWVKYPFSLPNSWKEVDSTEIIDWS